MEILLIILIILIMGASIIWAVQFTEYQRYRKSARAMVALGESMTVSFGQIAVQLDRIMTDQGEVRAKMAVHEIDFELTKALVDIHSRALGIDTSKIRALNEEFSKVTQ